MELLDYLAVLRKRWISLVVTTLMVVSVTILLTGASTPAYQASTRLFFAVPGGESVTDLAQGSSFTEKQMSSYSQVATSPLVLDKVVKDLDLSIEASRLSSSIRATVPTNTVILEITVVSTDPESAASIANAVGQRLSEVVSSLYPERADGTQAVLATTLSPAEAPTSPVSPNPRRNLAVGLMLGLILGVGVALVRESLDTRIRSSRDLVSVTQRPLLGSVAFDPDAHLNPIVMVDEPSSLRAEAIRRLRTNLQFVNISGGPRSLLVTSSVASEGKTTTTVNLAVSLADAGVRVLLIDADLRRPSLHKMLGVEGAAGLTSVLIRRTSIQEVIQPSLGGRIDVLASGPIPPNPSELVGSIAMTTLIDEMKQQYDVILIDSPPLLPVTDAAVLSALVDGVIVVVGADRTEKAQLQGALAGLEAVGANILGLVLNKIPKAREAGYGVHYYNYAPSTDSQLDDEASPERHKRMRSRAK